MKNYLADIIAALLILLFVYSAMSKLMVYTTFVAQIKESPFVSNLSSVAWLVPVLEWLIVGLLLFSASRLAGFYASTCLLVLFTIYIGGMLAFAPHLPCSCGGVLKQLSWKQHLVFNGIFILIAILGILLDYQSKQKSYLYGQKNIIDQ